MPREDGTFEITFNAESMSGLLSELQGAFIEAIDRALIVVAEQLLKDSKLYVPVLTGQLRDSGRTHDLPDPPKGFERRVQVIYGDADVIYAWIQHETPFNHPSLGFFGPAKYLEKPLTLNAAYYEQLFIAEVEIGLTRGYRYASRR